MDETEQLLAQVVADFEARFPAVKNFDYESSDLPWMSTTGADYEEILSGGLLKEGGVNHTLCTSKEHAIRLWENAAHKFASTRTGTLYWRVRPELDRFEYFSKDPLKGDNGEIIENWVPIHFWRVYSRFTIDDGEEYGQKYRAAMAEWNKKVSAA